MNNSLIANDISKGNDSLRSFLIELINNAQRTNMYREEAKRQFNNLRNLPKEEIEKEKIENRKGKKTVQKKKVKEIIKDPLKPKRPITGYFLFLNDRRKEFMKTHDLKNPAEANRMLGKAWKELSEAEKKPFLEEANKNRQIYEKKLAEYNEGKKKGKKGKRTPSVKYIKRENNDVRMTAINTTTVEIKSEGANLESVKN